MLQAGTIGKGDTARPDGERISGKQRSRRVRKILLEVPERENVVAIGSMLGFSDSAGGKMLSRFHDEVRYGSLASRRPSDNATSPVVGGRPKRFVDIAVATLALLAFLPLFALVAITVVLSDGRPIFYGHLRIGHSKRPFRCLKFRTMVVNGEEVLRHHLQNDREAAREWAQTRKLKRDPRVTAVGTVLRKLSLDELPQLLNVLRGEMSIVGPRPIVVDEVGKYGTDIHYYLQVRPGITGAWQVSGRNDQSYDARVALDRAYVENWSLLKDVGIICKTIPAVLTTRGSC